MNQHGEGILLVVGVSGLIGRNTAKFFRDGNSRVRGVSRGFGEYRTASSMGADLAGIELMFGDISESSFAERALRGVTRIVYAAGVSGVAASVADPAASRHGTLELWSALVGYSKPGTRIVMMSSQLVYGPSQRRPFTEADPLAPASPYAVNLTLMEEEGRRRAGIGRLEVVSLRLGNVFGEIMWIDKPRSHGMVALMLHDLVRNHEIRLFGGGDQTVSLLHVTDLARAISLVMGHESVGPFSVFNVSGEQLSVRSVAESLGNGVGRGTNISVAWPAGLERTVANDMELDDSNFRARFGWRPVRSVIAELEQVAHSYVSAYSDSSFSTSTGETSPQS
jgi:nucleoside-diphosphate-sugar epimerase